jgi:hypothetical protein
LKDGERRLQAGARSLISQVTTCEASSHLKDSERRLQAGARFNLSSAKIMKIYIKRKDLQKNIDLC